MALINKYKNKNYLKDNLLFFVSLKKRELDAREFSIKTNIESNSSQFPQKISAEFYFIKQQTLKSLSYAFPGFSIMFVGYILINIVLNYPPKNIGISP